MGFEGLTYEKHMLSVWIQVADETVVIIDLSKSSVVVKTIILTRIAKIVSGKNTVFIRIDNPIWIRDGNVEVCEKGGIIYEVMI